MFPSILTHYYERDKGPLLSLTELPDLESEDLLENIRRRGDVFASRRDTDYLRIRRELESLIREKFIAKGGQPQRMHPHYFILGECAWCAGWYREPVLLQIPLVSLDPLAVCFTYGDSFPAMRYQDGRPYRGQVYTLAEIEDVVQQYGLPQDWNPEGKLAPERYIEAQICQDVEILTQ
jgi:hypothetical protein